MKAPYDKVVKLILQQVGVHRIEATKPLMRDKGFRHLLGEPLALNVPQWWRAFQTKFRITWKEPEPVLSERRRGASDRRTRTTAQTAPPRGSVLNPSATERDPLQAGLVDWDFRAVDRLAKQPAGQGRLHRAPDRATSGKGVTLLFIHGAFHGAWCWSRYIAFCDENRLGRRGGRSPRPWWTAAGRCVWRARPCATWAQDAVAAARLLGDDVVLVGHSFGALVALAAAREVSAKAVILLAPAALNGLDLPSFASDALVAPPPEARARSGFSSDVRATSARTARVSAPRALRF